jgi:hypothetical protein
VEKLVAASVATQYENNRLECCSQFSLLVGFTLDVESPYAVFVALGKDMLGMGEKILEEKYEAPKMIYM